ncbi:heavy metal transporter [Streptomyces sp. NPDC058001]|uniref:heavy metal transporter n=1 Tax=Streptomyces sp. NPDC058001 TaxID=3346300 RepID=UPI0036EC4700
MPEPPAPARRGRLLRIGVAGAVLLAVAGYLIAQYATGGRPAPRCEVVSGKGDGASYRFTTEQAANAATIAVVGTARGMPERAVTIALATALQESGLRNLDHGDRDSLGLFQQRPSQGWGTAEEIKDPAHAAATFYRHLAEVPGYARLPLTVAAQRVQHSAYPQAYARYEPDATLLSATLTGRAPATLTCENRPSARAGSPSEVRAALVRDFGRDVLQEIAATSGRNTPATPSPTGGSGDTAARTVTVPVPATAASPGESARQRGWELAQWAVANSSALRIERVTYAGMEWTPGMSHTAWRKTSGGSDAVRIVTGQ